MNKEDPTPLDNFANTLTTRCLRSEDGQLIMASALRYCLGRRSYIVAAAESWFLEWKHAIKDHTKRIMVRDIVEALQKKCAGDDCDETRWKNLALVLYDELCQEDKKWVQDSVHNDCNWPL